MNNSDLPKLRYDITIMGAGLVGLAAAIALHQAGFSVVLVDVKSPVEEDYNEAWDNRVYAISPKNATWLTNLGVWSQLNPARQCAIQAMQIWGDAAQAPLDLLASAAHVDNLGFIVEARALEKALTQQISALGIATLFDTFCTGIKANVNQAKLYISHGQSQNPDAQNPDAVADTNITCFPVKDAVIESQILLAADGCHSWVCEELHIHAQQTLYHQKALVANFSIETGHDNIARQWFKVDEAGNSHILAWLPLPENKISIVWSVSNAYGKTLLALSDVEFTEQVMLAGDLLLGKIALISKVASFPLTLRKAHQFVQDSVILVGDAAHQIHPMAGQGVNLGFRDIIDLINVQKEKNPYQAINDTNLLKHYMRLRKADVMTMVLLTDGLYRLFNSKNTVIKKVRNWGLAATQLQAIKKKLVIKAIGL